MNEYNRTMKQGEYEFTDLWTHDDDPTITMGATRSVPDPTGYGFEEVPVEPEEHKPENTEASAHYLNRVRARNQNSVAGSNPEQLELETIHSETALDIAANAYLTADAGGTNEPIIPAAQYRTAYTRALNNRAEEIGGANHNGNTSAADNGQKQTTHRYRPHSHKQIQVACADREEENSGVISRREYVPDDWEEYAPQGNRSIRRFISPKALITLGAVVCVLLSWAIFQTGAPQRTDSSQIMAADDPPGTSSSPATSPTGAPASPTTSQGEMQNQPHPSQNATDSTHKNIRVHVAGAVHSAGVYSLPTDARAIDALNAAGGATDEADLNRVNLAGALTDGVQLYIPKSGENPPQVANNNTVGASASGTAPAQPNHSANPPQEGTSVNLNTATSEQLQTLPRIGPALATRIIAWRDEHGGFKSVDELDAVPGIGPTMMSSLRPMVTV